MLTLAALALVAVAAVACDGGDSSSPGDSASPQASPIGTPGTGAVPIQAVLSYIEAEILDGQAIDTTRKADCPLEETAVAGEVNSRLSAGQFCLTTKDFVPDQSLTIIAELTDTGETWDMSLEFDSEAALWIVTDVEKISD